MEFVFIIAVGLVAGTLSGIVGFGSSIMLMPVLVIAFGPLQAVPIMAIAAIMANLSRIVVWWRDVDWRTVGAYSATAVPCAALGAATLLVLPVRLIEAALGVFFLSMIVIRRWMAAHDLKLRRTHLALLGVPVGYLTGIVVSTGPITAPIFLAAGLVKGAFLSSEAAASLAVYLAKAAVFRTFGALPWDIAVMGLITGSTLMAGAFIAKRFVLKMEPDRFRLLMDGLMLLSGVTLLLAALLSASPARADDGVAAGFAGTWTGKWESGMEHKLIVEKVEGTHAVFVYRAGERARAESIPSGANRYDGVIVDRVLHGKLSNGAQLTYTLSADGNTLNGHYARNGKGRKGVFERR